MTPWEAVIGGIARALGPRTALWFAGRALKNETARIERLSRVFSDVNGLPVKVTMEDGQLSIVPVEEGSAGAAYPVRPPSAQLPQFDPNFVFGDEPKEVRIWERYFIQEKRRQARIEETLDMSIEDVKRREAEGEERDPDASTGQGWYDRYFRHIGEVDEKEVQQVWAQVLSGETMRPGSFSPKTLDVLSQMSVSVARSFDRVASLRVVNIAEAAMTRNQPREALIPKSVWHDKLSVNDQVNLVDFGLVNSSVMTATPLSLNTGSDAADGEWGSIVMGRYLIRYLLTSSSDRGLPVGLFTEAGLELSRLVPIRPDEASVRTVAESLAKQSAGVEVRPIVSLAGGKVLSGAPLYTLEGALPPAKRGE